MIRSQSQIASDIISKLNIMAPGLSCELGSPERKIIDAVAESIADAYLDQYLLEQNWNIDTLVGNDLEEFVSLFGFGRLQGVKSTGDITFYLSGPATQQYTIPAGTLVYAPATEVRETLSFTTLTPAVLDTGDYSVTIPAQCSTAGIVGNVTSDSVIGISAGTSVARVNNVGPFAGGVDVETDDDLRQRFKDTFLRNIAGTKDFYSAIASRDLTTTKVNVVGPISRYTEQLQYSGSPMNSTVQNSKFTWPSSFAVSKDTNTEDEVYFAPGADYNASTTVPPTVTVVNTTAIPSGTILDIEHEYVSLASRNDPANGISNKIDIFVNGIDPVQVNEVTAISSTTLNTTGGSPYNINNFRRVATEALPVSGNRIQLLGSTPVIAFPDSLTISGTTYTKGVNYHILRGTTSNRGSERELAGIEWITTAPTAGTPVTLTYSYNRLPQTMNAVFREEKQLGTDPLVHTNRYRYLRVNVVVTYGQGFSPSLVNTAIQDALSAWMASMSYGAFIQFSDIEQIVHNVPGVDQVRIAQSTDNATNYKVQNVIGGVSQTPYAGTFQLQDDELPSLSSVSIIKRGANTYNA